MEELITGSAFKFASSLLLALIVFLLNAFKNELKETKEGFLKTFQAVSNSIKDMEKSVNTLNVNIAHLVEKDLAKNEKLKQHEEILYHQQVQVGEIKNKISVLEESVKNIKQDIV